MMPTRTILAMTAAVSAAALCLCSTASAQLPGAPRTPPRVRMPDILTEPLHANSDDTLPPLWGVAADGAPVVVSPDAPPAWDRMVALLVDPPRAAHIDPQIGTLILADGQRIRGTLQTAAGAAQWKSRWLPLRALESDGVRAIILAGDQAPAATDNDIVVLANGDRIEGIVAAMDAVGLQVERRARGKDDTANPPAAVPWDRLRSVSFVCAEVAPKGARAWLTDGTVIDAAVATWSSGDTLQLGPAPGSTLGARTNVPRSSVLGVQRSPGSVLALAALVPTISTAADGDGLRFMVTAPHSLAGDWALGVAPIEVEGPVKLSYPAPPAAAALVFQAGLDAGVRAVGVVELVVRAGGHELHRARLDSANPRRSVSVALPAAPFEIELLAADGSAVGDVVRFDRAVLLPQSPR